MIESTQIKKMVSHILRRQRGAQDYEPMNPAREWVTGVVATFCFVCLGGFLSYGLYLSTITLEGEDPVSATTIPYNAARVDEALLKYQEKTKAYNDIIGRVGGGQIETPKVETDIPEPDVSIDDSAAQSGEASSSAGVEPVPVLGV